MVSKQNGIGTRVSVTTSLPCATFLRVFQYGFHAQALSSMLRPQDLNRILLTKVNHTGSDVRISTGDILNPKAFPRQGAEASWWNWEPGVSLSLGGSKNTLTVSNCAPLFWLFAITLADEQR